LAAAGTETSHAKAYDPNDRCNHDEGAV